MTVDVMFSCADRHEQVYFDCWTCPVCELREHPLDDAALMTLVAGFHQAGQAGGLSEAAGE